MLRLFPTLMGKGWCSVIIKVMLIGSWVNEVKLSCGKGLLEFR